MVQASVIRIATATPTCVFSTLSHQRLRSLPPLYPAHLAENVRAEYLHLASLGGDAHMTIRLATAAIG